MSWIVREFKCLDCGSVHDAILGRLEDEATTTHPCVCGGTAERIFSAPAVLNHTLPSGNGRFNGLREKSKLQREAAEAKKSGDRETEHKARAELTKVKS